MQVISRIMMCIMFLALVNLIISTILVNVKNLDKYRIVNILVNTTSVVGSYSLVFGIILLIFYLFLASIFVLNKFLVVIFNMFFIKKVSAYLALTVTLIFFSHFPSKIGVIIFRFFKKVQGYKYNLEEVYIKFVECIKFKFWVYITAMMLTIVTSINSLIEPVNYTLPFLGEVQDIAIQAVVTFMMYETLSSYIYDEMKNVKNIVMMIKDKYTINHIIKFLKDIGEVK